MVLKVIQRYPKGVSVATLLGLVDMDAPVLMAELNDLAGQLAIEFLAYSDGSSGVRAYSQTQQDTLRTLNAHERTLYILVASFGNRGIVSSDY